MSFPIVPFRRQLPVVSPIAVGALPRAALAVIAGDGDPGSSRAAVRAALGRKFAAAAVALTDSGTSALVLAIRMVVPPNGTIALPAYGCPDLLAAAVFAGVRLRFYDLDPQTLSPELESVRAALARGAQAVVIAHWYGYPADVRAVSALARESGAVVIEDAAQHGEGALDGAALGTTGPLTVLSFGRGKGTTAGSGGALLAIGATWSNAVETWEARQEPMAPRGWRVLAGATAQWVLGRPWLYGIPSALPGLHLGETIYRPAHEPQAMSAASVVILKEALMASEAVGAARGRVAASLEELIRSATDLAVVRPVPGGRPGYLRLAVRDRAGRRPDVYAGIVRGYPRPLPDEATARGVAGPPGPAMLGAAELCRDLYTLPTHSQVTAGDRARIERWAGLRAIHGRAPVGA